MSNPKLTERDKNNLTDEIRDKMVNTLCSKIMDESASDSQLISGVLKKNLGDKINDILSNPSNEAKISETIFQAINASLRNTIKGPLLLYSILNNKESFNKTKVLITKIFTNVYNNSTNKSLKVFITNLITKLNNPPYDIWFNQQVKQTTGGKRRKTMRSRKKKRSRTYRNRQKGGDIRGNISRSMGLTGADAAEQARAEAKSKREANKTLGKSWGIKKTLGMRSKEDEAAYNEKYEKQKTERAEEGKKQMQEGWDRMMGRETSDDDNGEVTEGEGENAEEEEEEEEEGANEENAEEEEGAADEGAGSGSGVDTDQLYNEYNEELINRLIKRLDETEDDMLERLLNATYQYSRDNSGVILDSINNAIYDTAKINGLLPESTDIIITQALYASSLDIKKTLQQTYTEFRESEVSKGIPSDQVKFVPTQNSFINDFLQKLTVKIKERVNLSV
jgi:hypothetical protein